MIFVVHCVSPLMMPLKYQCSDITFYDVVHKTGGVVAKVDGSCQSDAVETGSKLSLAPPDRFTTTTTSPLRQPIDPANFSSAEIKVGGGAVCRYKFIQRNSLKDRWAAEFK